MYLIEILHQTTTPLFFARRNDGCILLKFYIKPQRYRRWFIRFYVVSYWNSTSNHNKRTSLAADTELYLIEILHQTTTFFFANICNICCILLKFYIKPQHTIKGSHRRQVVSYWNSTSNHNMLLLLLCLRSVVSYWNSTSNHNIFGRLKHQIDVVSYWNSTSNHNNIQLLEFFPTVVSYWNSTSNHNSFPMLIGKNSVVSYWNSTSNHNREDVHIEFGIVVSYWNSTSNHNIASSGVFSSVLYLIEILHQTTTSVRIFVVRSSCILLKFYIKPQRSSAWMTRRTCCILLKFYIKPQLMVLLASKAARCILLKFYIKPQRSWWYFG